MFFSKNFSRYFSFILLFIISLTLINCTDNNNKNYTYNTIDLKTNQLHTKNDLFFYRTNLKDTNITLQKANAIIKNERFSLMGTLPSTKFLGYDYPYKLSTVKLYYNSLRRVAFLTDAYFLTSEKQYIENAISLYNIWREKEVTGKLKNRYVWSDHSASNRTLTLIYLLRAGNNNIDEKSQNDIVDCLIQHGDWLYDDKNYNDHGNHGVMQDRALLELGIFLDNKSYIKKATERIKKAFKRDFSKKGVHYENSIEYDITMLNMYRRMFRVLNNQKNTQIITNGKKYIQTILKPILEFPFEGDTSLPLSKISEKLFDNFFDLDSGKVIINEKNLNYPEKSNYIFFKSGYVSFVHKHFDDLSFLLTANGNNVFIDSGKYNYEAKDPFRKYILSPKAHNTVYLDNTKYSLNKKKYIPKITFYKKTSNYIYSQGTIYINGEFLERNLIYAKGVIFLIDKGIFQTPKKMHQNFNISNDVVILSAEQEKALIQNGDKNITITQHHKVDNIKKFYGDKKNIRGFISHKFNKLIPIHQIEYSMVSKNPIFLTEINTDIANIKISDVSYNVQKNNLYFSINGEKREVHLAK